MKGASLIELLIAVALALVISAVGVRALVEAADAFAWQPASTELSLRADAVAQLHGSPVLREKLAAISMVPWQATPQQFVAALSEERKRFDHLVKAVGYQKEDA